MMDGTTKDVGLDRVGEHPVSEEQTWVEQARAGDEEAFSRLVEAYQTPVYNLTYRMLGNVDEAEEAAQETFLRVYTRLDRYNPAYKFSTWVLSIASHHCIDRLRKRRITWLSLDEPLPAQFAPQLSSSKPGPETSTIKGEMHSRVQALLDTLQPDYRAAVVLRYWYDMSYEEIADTAGTTVSAIKSRLFRARKMLAASAQTAGVSMAEAA
jgi:RNA polymerase sigma-70 factor (ECF subfamily)